MFESKYERVVSTKLILTINQYDLKVFSGRYRMKKIQEELVSELFNARGEGEEKRGWSSRLSNDFGGHVSISL